VTTEQPGTEEVERTVEDVEKTGHGESADDDQVGGAPVKGFARRLARRLQSRLGPLMWLLPVVACVSLFAALAVFLYRPDQQTDDAAARSAIAAASEGTVAVYSYASNTVDRDIASAKSHLTGDFLAQYEREATTAVQAVAKQKVMKTSAAVVGAAVSRLRPDSADVLIFLNQTTTTADAPGPSMTVGSLMVSLSKVDGKWLISAMKPV
jgi:Mce-associated membrane protein